MNFDLTAIQHFIEVWGYLLVFAGIAIESTGIPFPGETTLLVAAATAATSSQLHIEWVILWAAVGAIVGDNFGYWAGRKFGRPILKRVGPLLHFTPKKQAYLETYFERHGAKTVFLGRFIAILRTWTAFFAGLNHMHYPTFLKYNALGGFTWAIVVGLLGFIFGTNLPLLAKWLGNFSYVVLGLLILLGIGFMIIKRRKQAEKL